MITLMDMFLYVINYTQMKNEININVIKKIPGKYDFAGILNMILIINV